MRRFVSIIILLIVFVRVSYADMTDTSYGEQKYRFSHITTQNSGLSYDGVRCMLRDSRGYVWIGTQKGLSRYDGARFKVFDRRDFRVDSDYVNSLYEDSKGHLLIGTDRGVVLYDPVSDTMNPLPGLSCRVYTMCGAGESLVYLGVKSEGLYVYESNTGIIGKVNLVNHQGKELRDIYRIVIAKDNTMYMAAYCDNIYRVSLNELGTNSVNPLPCIEEMFYNDDIEGLAVNPKNTNLIYVLSQGYGLVEINILTSVARPLIRFPENVFLTTLQFSEGKLWVTSSLGLYEYDTHTGSTRRYISVENDRYSLSDNHTTCLLHSDGGKSMWVGTYGGGINVYSSAAENFRKYYRTNGRDTFDGCNVRCFAEDTHGRLWVGTENSGLLYLLEGSSFLEQYEPGCGIGAVKALMSEGEMLWIGTNNGLWMLDLRTGSLCQPVSSSSDNPLHNRRILDLIKGSDGRIYVGTAVGAYIYDIESCATIKIEGTGIDAIEDIVEDYSGTIWMATYSNGIYSFNPHKENELRHFCSKYDDTPVPEMVSSLSLDNDGNLWVIGFSSGLLKYDMKSGAFSVFNKTVIPSLPTNLFYSCLHDDMGNLWLASDAALVLLNPERRSVKVYDESSGVLENTMRSGHLKLSSGELAFGFNSGAVVFDPKMVLNNEKVNKPVITDLYAHGKKISHEDGIVKKNTDQTMELEFDAQHRSFAFDFAVPLSELFVKYNLFCQLEGYDNDWRDVTVQKSVSYHNVPPGVYHLKVKAVSAINAEENHHYPVTVTINPHFFQSPAGILTVIIMVIILVLSEIAFLIPS